MSTASPPHLHHLHSEQPPINTLALPDLSKISLLLSSADKNSLPPPDPSSIPTAGILKRDWLLKHRTRVPAVVAALFSSDHVSGIPLSGFSFALTLKTSNDISEDGMIALCKRAELDAKCLVIFNPSDSSQLKQSLNKLGSTFAELANTYYRDEGRRIKTRVEKKSFNSNELNIRYCFKVAVYAEFRRDWVEALRFYEDAYHTLREMIGTANRLPVIQRLVEIKTVAEQLHFKISTLLLHGGKVIEAVTWFRQHFASYRKLLGAAEAIFLHWEWMSRQFLVFAELLEISSKAIHSNSNSALGTSERSFTEWEFHPAYYYQLAGHYLKEKTKSFALSLSMLQNADEIDGSSESVTPSVYVGQFARLLEQGDAFAVQPLTDEEYTRYAIAEGKRFQDSFEIIALLKKSYESYINLKAQRMASHCGFLMAQEYFAVSDFSNAKQLLDGVAALYRQEGWVTLLWEVLGFLRECSRKCGILKEFIEYSLEMAALPVSSGTGVQSFRANECGPAGPASLAQRENIHKEVFSLSAEKQGVAFHEQIIKPGVPALITLSLLSQLPLTVDIDQVEVQFNQSECNFIIINAQKPPSAEISKPTKSTEQSGKLECIYVIAKMGPHFTICCRAESPASMDDLPLWKFEDRVETFPTKDPALAFSGQKLAQVEEPDPQVDLILGATGPALVGECFVIPVTVASKGHDIFSGELKINLVDVRGGGLFSPREAEPFSMDNHHVELLGVNGPEGEDESPVGYDKIKKIQQSFGLVSVPVLQDGESWSCKLEIKWHRPKPIMVFVSLGYFRDSNEMTSQKIHVHKNLQIEGKTAVLISHHFMLPFRQDPLLLSKLKPVSSSDQGTSLPLKETSILRVSAKNCSEVPLQLQSMSIEMDDDVERSFTLHHSGEDIFGPAYLVPGEEFKKVFTVIPEVESSNLNLGSVSLRWRRNLQSKDQSSSTAEAWVLTRHKLPDVNVELSPLVLTVDCPPYAILGDPFTYSVKIRNQTQLLQEVKFSLADAQSFVISGSHSDTVFVLPKSEHVLGYKIVPLASGLQQLPRVTVISVRYSAGFQPSNAASTVFVFPTKPHFKTADMGDKGMESIVAD
ncbi:hypothetical protein GH714_028028 [Hevea brasiliensis]|uniref:Trafficking protein particle complex subunit 11 domain-containing protein n=1 Tax=Hevea brasiliensis TaxID=3981 RepID=A0A6A6KW44_HEVBR|nr:hypothetical protein GH714_028028 [Hevea brasiliensis]